jgi:hypothetical protein
MKATTQSTQHKCNIFIRYGDIIEKQTNNCKNNPNSVSVKRNGGTFALHILHQYCCIFDELHEYVICFELRPIVFLKNDFEVLYI